MMKSKIGESKAKNKILTIIGARPQFIKHYPFEVEALKVFELVTVHTGQHYDANMSEVFFNQLQMRKPNYHLNLGGGNHGMQTGKMMMEIEKIVIEENPQALLVYGDTNSTLAGALVASKLHIPVVHVEAGLRSFNKKMPEEINRVLTDYVSDLLLVPSETALNNLKKENISDNVYVVGDIMKDLVQLAIHNQIIQKRLVEQQYYYVTLHRPYNVDQKDRLETILSVLNSLNTKIIFAAHPRTQKRINDFGLADLVGGGGNVEIINPQPYFENLSYLFHSEGLITDSGGMQKEAYWLKKKCTTIRSETEWVETMNDNANILIFEDMMDLKSILERETPKFDEKLYGAGNTAQVIVNNINNYFLKNET